jgi:hypothetical protein
MASDTYSICMIVVCHRIREVYIPEIIANTFMDSNICIYPFNELYIVPS